MKISFIESGYCVHPEFFLTFSFRDLNKISKFPNTVVLIDHPSKGKILFDTGYSSHFFDATASYPERIYRDLTPVTLGEGQSAARKLKLMGIDSTEINYIILSHFHADHVSGILDFPRAKFIFIDQAYKEVKHLNRLFRLKAGFLQSLIPSDFESRSLPLNLHQSPSDNTILEPFTWKVDIFGDGSIFGVSLPGHVAGHMGIYLETNNGKFLFAGDSCWYREEYLGLKKLGFGANFVIQDRKCYDDTLARILRFSDLNSSVQIIPCHCGFSHSQLPQALHRV